MCYLLSLLLQISHSSMKVSILILSLLALLLQPCRSKTVLVNGVAEWRSPSLHIGDSIIFKQKQQLNLYIFRSRKAFSHCNFAQATLLNKPNSTSFTWHPSRPGFFYFYFTYGSINTCEESEKLAVRVIPKPPENPAPSPEFPPQAAPSPTSGGVVSSSPANPWPFRSRQATSPTPAPNASPPAVIQPILPDKGGRIPFISSNPVVPLPTGEDDSAAILPLPTSGQQKQVVGFVAVPIVLCYMLFMML